MIKKSMQNRGFNYEAFENPYKALVAMIFVQAQSDLEELNGESRVYKNGNVINKWEIVNFLRSDWGLFLANSVGVSTHEYTKYVRLATG